MHVSLINRHNVPLISRNDWRAQRHFYNGVECNYTVIIFSFAQEKRAITLRALLKLNLIKVGILRNQTKLTVPLENYITSAMPLSENCRVIQKKLA